LDYPQELLSSAGRANQINFNPLIYQTYMQKIVPSLCGAGDDEQYGSTVLCDIAALQALSRRIHYGKFVAESKYQSNPKAYQELVEQSNDAAVMALLTDPVVERKVLLRARLKATTYGREPLVLTNLLSKDIMDHYYYVDDNKSNDDAVANTNVVVVEEDTDDLSTLIAATAAASAVVAALDALQHQQQHKQQQQQPQHQVNGDDNKSPLKALRPKVDPMVIESIYRDIIIPLTKDVEVAYLFRRCGHETPPQYNVMERMKRQQQEQEQQWQS
jgi:chorismate mutase